MRKKYARTCAKIIFCQVISLMCASTQSMYDRGLIDWMSARVAQDTQIADVLQVDFSHTWTLINQLNGLLLAATGDTITIDQPGIYYLASDLNSPIMITSSGVILDLRGHTMQGDGSQTAMVLNNVSHVCICNGIYANWAQAIAVHNCSNIQCTHLIIENGQAGISFSSADQVSIDQLSAHTIVQAINGYQSTNIMLDHCSCVQSFTTRAAVPLVQLSYCASSHIRACNFSSAVSQSTGVGVSLVSCVQQIIESCFFNKLANAIQLVSCMDVRVARCMNSLLYGQAYAATGCMNLFLHENSLAYITGIACTLTQSQNIYITHMRIQQVHECGILVQGCTGGEIAHNYISQVFATSNTSAASPLRQTNSAPGSAIVLTNVGTAQTGNLVISHNTCINNGGDGIFLDQDTSSCVVMDNNLFNNQGIGLHSLADQTNTALRTYAWGNVQGNFNGITNVSATQPVQAVSDLAANIDGNS